MAFQKQQGAPKLKSKKKNILETKRERVSWLDDITTENKTVEDLVAVVTTNVEAEPVYYKHVNEIYSDLHQIMKFFYKQHVKILLFGSSVTKLALCDSDVDIYLDFGEKLPEPPKKLVKTLRNKVGKYGYFTRAIPILARVPIVHCVHRTQISCDISFLNALGFSNSQLIKFFLSTDKRIRPLILILKFIMKSHGLLGQNAFSSYALIILILFFLQTLKNPIIPSVSHIQNLASRREIVADWDTSFTIDIQSLPAVNNQLSVVELLQKFFEYYSTFEFGFYIISSFTGKSYLKPVFSNPDLIPQEFYLYKENIQKNETFKFDYNKFICVQGPFNHGNNVTSNIMQKSLIHFQNLCWTNAAVGKELLNGNEENQKKYLLDLFEESKSKKQKKDDVVIFVGEKIELNSCSYTEDNMRNEWSKHTFRTLQDILCRVMKCEIDVQSNSDSLCSTNDEKVIKCKMPYSELVSKKRSKVKSEFNFPENMSIIEKEEIISDYLCDTLLKNTKKVFLNFDVICCVKKRPTCFCIDLNCNESEKANIHLVQNIFQFIRNYVPKWIK